MKKFEYIKKNMNTVRLLYKNECVNFKVMADYRIYNTLLSNTYIRNKSERYMATAIDENVSVRTVYRAVKNMESRIK